MAALEIDLTPYIGCLKHRAFNKENSLGTRDPVEDFVSVALLETDPFVRDMGFILNSKAIRRLERKTQVFIAPQNPHVRNRMQHTNEVAATAIQIASLLGLNTTLTQAIALGHDLGHAPYGHLGEEAIAEISGW